MQIKIGKKIKELRCRDGRTQDDLAAALGVTCQAISRWEASGGYPDMEIVPAIANYFHVTIDELFGYHGDRIEQIKAIVDKANQYIDSVGGNLEKGSGDITECVEMLRTAAEEFPNEPQILLKLGNALHILGWQKNGAKAYTKDGSDYIYDDTEYNSQNVYWQEALHVYEKLLKMDVSADCREAAVSTMVMLYKKTGYYEKAKALANEQNSIVFSKEVLLSKAAFGEEMDQYQGENILALLQELYAAVFNSVATKISIFTSEYGRSVLLSLANLLETILSDGRCGSEHRNLRHLYLTLASDEARYDGDIHKALDYFDKAFKHHKEYCRICNAGEYRYSAPLVSNVTAPSEKFPSVPQNFWESVIQNMPNPICNELRKIEKYAECFQ